MSLLSIVQGAANELGLIAPVQVFASTDPNVIVLRQLADKEGKELARRYDWQVIQREGQFTTVASETQVTNIRATYPDFGHVVSQSMWNRSQGNPVHGPLTAVDWQMRKSAAAQAGYANWYRIRGNAILFFPVPPPNQLVAFEYITNSWCLGVSGDPQDSFANDLDSSLIDEEIVRLGVVWRFRKAKGFDYGEDFRTYEMALQDIFGPDSGRPILDMTGDTGVGQFGVNIPDGNWPLV
jgi:hypothetical protein